MTFVSSKSAFYEFILDNYDKKREAFPGVLVFLEELQMDPGVHIRQFSSQRDRPETLSPDACRYEISISGLDDGTDFYYPSKQAKRF
jgi:hypothetical protein